MSLYVDCECGTRIDLSPSMAGSQMKCRCGREINIPSLSKLRQDSGEAPYTTNALELIRSRLSDETLPGSECIVCRAAATEVIYCRVICERSSKKRSIVSDAEEQSLARYLAGFFIPFLSLARFIRVLSATRVETEKLGRDTSIEIAFCICQPCRRSTGRLSARKLRQLATEIPEYRQLFEEFPNANIRLSQNAL